MKENQTINKINILLVFFVSIIFFSCGNDEQKPEDIINALANVTSSKNNEKVETIKELIEKRIENVKNKDNEKIGHKDQAILILKSIKVDDLAAEHVRETDSSGRKDENNLELGIHINIKNVIEYKNFLKAKYKEASKPPFYTINNGKNLNDFIAFLEGDRSFLLNIKLIEYDTDNFGDKSKNYLDQVEKVYDIYTKIINIKDKVKGEIDKLYENGKVNDKKIKEIKEKIQEATKIDINISFLEKAIKTAKKYTNIITNISSVLNTAYSIFNTVYNELEKLKDDDIQLIINNFYLSTNIEKVYTIKSKYSEVKLQVLKVSKKSKKMSKEKSRKNKNKKKKKKSYK